MKVILFSWGPVHVYWFGVTAAMGMLAALYIAWREAKRKGLPPENVLDISLAAVLAGLVGARVLYVLLNLRYYGGNPAEILRIDEGGLSIHGAIAAGAMAAWLLCCRRKLSFLRTADALAPALALGEAVGRIGCDIVGKPGSGPFPIIIEDVRYHNLPLYSSLFLFGLFAYLWFYRRSRARFDGQVILDYVLWYSVGRFVLEFARTSPSSWLGLSLAQWVSLALILVSLAVYRRVHPQGDKISVPKA